MVRRALLLMFLLLVPLSAGVLPVEAATITGSTGLIRIPNADTLKPQSLEACAHVFADQSVLSLSFGLVPQVELAVNTGGRHNTIDVTLKGAVTPETKEAPGIAVGLDNGSAYLVFSRSFSGARGHVGFGNGRFNGLFMGLSLLLNPVSVTQKGKASPATTLMVEHDGSGVNAGARIAFTPEFKVDVAILDMEAAMLGLSYTARF